MEPGPQFKGARRGHFRRYWAAYVILLIALLTTGLIYYLARQVIYKRQQASFHQATIKFRHTMEVHFSAYVNILNGLNAFFAQENMPTIPAFKQFLEAQGLRTDHPCIFDMGYVGRIRASDRESFFDFARSEGIKDAYLPRFSPDKDEDYVLIHWDNFSNDSPLSIGSYIFTETNRLVAMQTARDSGFIGCTDRLDVRMGGGKVAPDGFILYAPVYLHGVTPKDIKERGEKLKGFAYASFFIPDFWKTICVKTGETMVRFQAYDGLSVQSDKLWYDSSPKAPSDHQPRFQVFQSVAGLGRNWTFTYASLPSFEKTPEVKIPGLILLAGSLVSTVLFALAMTQAQARDRAEDLATKLQLSNENMAAERQKLGEERIKNSKLESVGLLAGGIAHDFNNILTTIMGNISLAAMEMESPTERLRYLNEADTACARARDLTQQLLTFAKGGAPIRKTAVLGDVVRESARFASHGATARCECHLPDNMWPVEADTGQISQVIQNMVINAAEAMPEGGVIEIIGANWLAETDGVHGVHPGRYVKISITDQGAGIRPEHLDKIFDPYFSTKQRGSGLGLATAYSIIRRHDGSIKVESVPGKGTRFDIFLPASDKSPAPLPMAPAGLEKGQGVILIMDDERPIVTLLARMLEKLGYRSIPSYDGAEAARLFAEIKANGKRIDAVILDLTVPGGVGGMQALKQMQSIDPSVKAIVSSGYSNDRVMADHRAFGFQAMIEKPYRIEHVAEALKHLLVAAS